MPEPVFSDPSDGVFARAFAFRGRGAIALTGGALTILFAAVLFPAASARSGSPENDVLDLQRAHTVEQFAEVLQRWSAKNDAAVGIMKRENIVGLDSWFPAIYGLTLASLYAWVTARQRPTALDRWLIATPLAAAADDYVENALELYALGGIDTRRDLEDALAHHTFSANAIYWQSAAAHAKFALAGVSIGAILIVLGSRLIRLARPAGRSSPR